jgi:nicotinamide-nucleotide amidase
VISAFELVAALLEHGQLVATAESCTGGMVAAAITDIAGSSAVFDRGFVTYSNAAKTEMLGVQRKLIETFGAVSEQVALAMAEGAITRSSATIAVSITGVAGPSGGSETKPIGLVHFAIAKRRGKPILDKKLFGGDRAEVRILARDHALQMLGNALNG